MGGTIRVTPAQREAAALLLERARREGKDVDPAVQAIARAQRSEPDKRRGRRLLRST